MDFKGKEITVKVVDFVKEKLQDDGYRLPDNENVKENDKENDIENDKEQSNPELSREDYTPTDNEEHDRKG